ncbi:MAG: hypothetical protein AABY00_02320 [Nanoarchaeota archaeon]
MKNSLKNILGMGAIALATACSPTQVAQSVARIASASTNAPLAQTRFVTNATHSAIPVGTYTNTSTLTGSALGSFDTKAAKTDYEFIAVDGHIVEVRNHPYPATNELNVVFSHPLNGELEMSLANKSHTLNPSTVYVPTRWMLNSTSNVPVRQFTINPRQLKAKVADLENTVGASGNGVLYTSKPLADFSLNTRRIGTNDYCFFDNGSCGQFEDYALMNTRGMNVKTDLSTGILTPRNESGAYVLVPYSASDFNRLVEQRKSASRVSTNVPPQPQVLGISNPSP